MSGRVIVVGSVNVDLVARVERLPAPGETVSNARFERHPGGKGGNQATAAARLGATVEFVGAVGDDPFAGEARAALTAEGVGMAELAAVQGPTGVALILVDAGGENLIAVAPGANAAVGSHEVDRALRALAVRSGDVVVVSNEIPPGSVLAALTTARSAGATTLLNPAPATGIIAAHLAVADYLVPNRLELADLVRNVVARGRAADAPVDQLARPLLGGGGVALAIVVSVGARGAVLVRDGREPLEIAAPVVRAVDTVGAGDTLVGALAAGLAEGRDPGDAARRAVVAASLSTTRPGARGGMPTAAELDTALAAR